MEAPRLVIHQAQAGQSFMHVTFLRIDLQLKTRQHTKEEIYTYDKIYLICKLSIRVSVKDCR